MKSSNLSNIVPASDSEIDSPPRKRHYSLAQPGRQKSSSPVFNLLLETTQNDSSRVYDSDAYVNDSLPLISTSSLARAPIREGKDGIYYIPPFYYTH